MRVTLDALLVLNAIDRAGSFAGGAEQLFRVPSAVSYTIHKLEQDLGIRVFDRSGHRAKLTEAGAQLLKDGRELLRLAEELERKAKDVGAGREARLWIAVADVVPRSAVYPLLRAFHEVPEHESTHLQITMQAQATCWETLIAGRADLVIGAPEPGPDVTGFQTLALGEVELALVVPTTHPLARAQEPLPAHLYAHYSIVRQTAWPFGDRRDHASHELLMVDNYDSQVEAIRHGLGIGWVPAYLVQEDVAAGRLVTKVVANSPRLRLAAAWCVARMGSGLEWFLDQLRSREVRARLVSHFI
jgi:DNA-binding transcriptional LysR family regulator